MSTHGTTPKTIGIQALFYVPAILLPEQLESTNLKKETWRAHLQKAQTVDFTARIFHASGSGRGKVKKALLLAMGRLFIDEIDATDRAYFERALNG